MKESWFTDFLKTHPGARWRQTGGPPFPSKAGKKAEGKEHLPPPNELWAAYCETLSVHRVGEMYGASGETIRQRLIRAGYRLKGTAWSEEEVAILREWYSSHDNDQSFDLDQLAERLGRMKSNVSRKARELGLTDQRRKKQPERKPPALRKFATDEERRAAVSMRVKKYFAEHGHPRGALGMKHSEEARRRVSDSNNRAWADSDSGHNSEARRQRMSDLLVERNRQESLSNPYSRAAGGRRPDLDNRYFRSRWEANYARYLNLLIAHGQIAGWEYECQTFCFEEIKRGARSYTPDFKITLIDGSHEWHEIKGWMDEKSATKLTRMTKYHPDEKIVVIDEDWFKRARKAGLDGCIPNWESDRRHPRRG